MAGSLFWMSDGERGSPASMSTWAMKSLRFFFFLPARKLAFAFFSSSSFWRLSASLMLSRSKASIESSTLLSSSLRRSRSLMSSEMALFFLFSSMRSSRSLRVKDSISLGGIFDNMVFPCLAWFAPGSQSLAMTSPAWKKDQSLNRPWNNHRPSLSRRGQAFHSPLTVGYNSPF